MRANLQSHPGPRFGAWLKNARQRKGIVARAFAGQIGLSPSKYAEVEIGISKWMDHERVTFAAGTLDLTNDERQEMQALLAESQNVPPLKFSEVFSREELTPVRCCSAHNRPLTQNEIDKLLDAVFAELE